MNIIIVGLLSFLIVALASKEIGAFFSRYNLPLISGFLAAGVLVGPFGLNMLNAEVTQKLHFVDEIALGFIAFAAGSELYIKDLRGRLKGIAWVTIAQITITMLVGSFAVYFLLGFVPFMAKLPNLSRAAAAIMAGAILIARSPSSAIAIINELRAKGPFTQTILGVTVITDVGVIILFAISSEGAGAMLSNYPINFTFVALLIAELVISSLLGLLLGITLNILFSSDLSKVAKSILLLGLGYSLFVESTLVREYSHEYFHIEFLLEPLLIAMVATFYIINWTKHRDHLMEILEDLSPSIYIAFFTLTGAGLALDVLSKVWLIALALFLVRLLTIFLGSLSGGIIAGEPMKQNLVSWMAYITQAGVGLGLSKEIAGEFPSLGENFATLLIAVIVLNQIVGPPLFKWVINYVQEAHPRGKSQFDGRRDAIIFGTDNQASAVARLLKAQGWHIQWVCTDSTCATTPVDGEEEPIILPKLDLENLEKLDASKADAVVTMLSDDENYRISELFYEHYGTETLVVRLNDLTNRERFHQLNALTVHPGTATVKLLEQYVREPDTASLLLDAESKYKMRELYVRDPNLHGIFLRDLRLPTDTLIVAIHRTGTDIVSHGYTRLRLNDKLTVIGTQQSIAELELKFEV